MAVLVVDDELEARTLLSQILKQAGHTVIEAARAQAALDALGVQPIVVALVDRFMPDSRWPLAYLSNAGAVSNRRDHPCNGR